MSLDRYGYIDIFKGLGILSVIIAHIWVGDNPYRVWSAAFYMPMFFFISGFLFHDYEPAIFLKRKFNSLILPYLFFGFLNLIACALMLKHFNLAKYFSRLFFINNNPALPITGALWFLTSLFFANIIFYFTHKYLKKYYLEISIVILVLLEFIFKIKLPYSIDCAIFMLPFFYAGFRYKAIGQISDRLSILILCICFSISSFLIFQNGMVNVRMNIYNNLFLFYLNAFLMTFGLFYLSKFMAKTRLFTPVEYIGRHSLIFMCIHQIIMYYLIKIAKIPNRCAVLAIILISIYFITELYLKLKSIKKHQMPDQ